MDLSDDSAPHLEPDQKPLPRPAGPPGLFALLVNQILAAMADAADRTIWIKVGATLLAVAVVGYLVAPSGWFESGTSGTKRRRKLRKGRSASAEAADDTELTADDSDSNQVVVNGTSFYPPGLHNLGNTCFMNSTLQALASLPSLITFLETRVARHRLFQYASLRHRGRSGFTAVDIPVTEALLDILLELNASNKSSYRVLRPHDFLNALSRAANSSSQNGGGSVIGRRWLGFEQQDAHELYQLISSHIQTEHETCQSAKCGCCTGKKFQTTGLGDIFDLGPAKDAVVGPGDGRQELRMRNPSLGLVGSRLRCEECGYETPVRHQTFDNLSLVPPYEPTITLSALLAFYTSPEYLDDVVCPRCSIKLTLEKLKVLIDKGRKKCEIARKVYEAQAKEKEGQVPSEGAVVANGHSAAEAQPASNGKDQKGVAQAAEVNSLSALFPKIATLPSLPRETLALLDLPFSAIQEELSLPPEDSEPAILRIDTELRRLHDLLHDLDLLERTSPDEFLDLEKDKLSIEKVRHVPTPPHRTTKRLTISRFPKVLALHVQRSVYLASGRAVKNSCRIGGLGELWDASLPGARRRSGIFARADGGGDSARQLYQLQAIVLHYGSHDSGHFVTYRRMPAKGFGNPGQWAQIEEALEKIARGQDPQGRLAAWVDEWCSATLGIPKESAPAKTTEATNPTEVTDSENGHVSAAPNGDAATTPAPIIQDNVADSLAVDTSLSAAKPDTAAPGGDSPTLHGSVDGDGTADTALDTDTDTGSNAFAGADGDLSSSQPDLVALRPEGSDHAPTPVPGQQPLGSDATLSASTPNVSAPSPSPKFVKPAKPPRPADTWFRISDEHVELVEDPEREIYAMLSGQAYMFYFEREE